MSVSKYIMTLLVNNKSGTLSAIMFKGHNAGLTINSTRSIKINENNLLISVSFEGNLTCSKTALIWEMESHSGIHCVESFHVYDSDVNHLSFTTKHCPAYMDDNKFLNLSANDMITQESLEVAIDKLSVFIGPISASLVDLAAEQTNNIGDLFILLAKQLSGVDRDEFLGLVDRLNIDKL